MKFIDLNKNLKQKIAHTYSIVGNDFFLIRQAISILKSHIVHEFEDFNYIKLDADKLKKDDVLIQLTTLPFNNEYRLVILSNPNNDIVKYLNDFDFTDLPVIVVCINADKFKAEEIIDCTKLDREDIVKYILNYLAKSNLSIEERALDYFIDATNGVMSNIVNELNKITAYATEEKSITFDVVTNLVSNSNEYVIYMLTNAIDKKNYTEYQKILNTMSKSQSYAEIFSYLGKYFRRMQYISLNKNDDELASILNIKPYAIKMSRQNITKNGIKYYINLYQKYTDLDYQIKSGEITPYNALYELVF